MIIANIHADYQIVSLRTIIGKRSTGADYSVFIIKIFFSSLCFTSRNKFKNILHQSAKTKKN